MAYYALHFRHARHQRCVQAFDRTNFYSRSDKIITSDKQLKAVWHTVWRTIKNKKKKNPDVWHQNSKVSDMHLRVTSPPLVSNKSNLWQSRKCLQYLLCYCLFVMKACTASKVMAFNIQQFHNADFIITAAQRSQLPPTMSQSPMLLLCCSLELICGSFTACV